MLFFIYICYILTKLLNLWLVQNQVVQDQCNTKAGKHLNVQIVKLTMVVFSSEFVNIDECISGGRVCL